MMALSTESSNAKISGMPITYLTQAALPKMWSQKLVYSVSGSAVLSEAPNTEEDERRADIDEHPVEALGRQGDLGVTGRVVALTDVQAAASMAMAFHEITKSRPRRTPSPMVAGAA